MATQAQYVKIKVEIAVPVSEVLKLPGFSDNQSILDGAADYCDDLLTGHRDVKTSQITDAEIEEFI